MSKKRIILGIAAFLVLLPNIAEARRGGYVHGYTRRDGTYVHSYYRGGSGGYSASDYGTHTFSSCAEARAAGFSNMTVGSDGYSSALDRDGDGIACESGSGGGSGLSDYSSSSSDLGTGGVQDNLRYTSTMVNLRSAPGTSSRKIARMVKGVPVSLVSCAASWCFVNVYEGHQGYVAQQYLRRKP